ncbi:MAG: deoxyhypusine synthase [Candidatus Helarchaeota archaeon]
MKLEEIRHVKVQPEMTLDQLIQEMQRGAGFGAKHLARATDIFMNMVQDKECTIFLTVAGAMIPGGMKQVLIDFLELGVVDVLIVTGATLTHDLIEAFGYKHFHGSAVADDEALSKEGLNRIYNVLLPNEAYEGFEDNIQTILKKSSQTEFLCSEFLTYVGKQLPGKSSIMKVAAERGIPIFCPAIADSILGFHIWMYSQTNPIQVDILGDQKRIIDIAYESKRKGALIIGGGTPKHYVAMAMQVTSKGLDYAIQITTDRPEPGGVSGASLQEAISWRKVDAKAQYVDVICDATIALPIMLGVISHRMKKKSRENKVFPIYK